MNKGNWLLVGYILGMVVCYVMLWGMGDIK